METFDFTADWIDFQRKYPTGENVYLSFEDYFSLIRSENSPLKDYSLEDLATYLFDLYDLLRHHSFHLSACREKLPVVRDAIWVVKKLFQLKLDSLSMDKEAIYLFNLLFSILIDLMNREMSHGERIEALERELEALKVEFGNLDHDLAKVEKKVKH